MAKAFLSIPANIRTEQNLNDYCRTYYSNKSKKESISHIELNNANITQEILNVLKSHFKNLEEITTNLKIAGSVESKEFLSILESVNKSKPKISLKKIDLTDKEELVNEDTLKKIVEILPDLESLIIDLQVPPTFKSAEELLEALKKLENIEKETDSNPKISIKNIDLSNVSKLIDGKMLKEIAKLFPALKSITIDPSFIGKADSYSDEIPLSKFEIAEALAYLPQLRKVEIWGNALSNKDAEILGLSLNSRANIEKFIGNNYHPEPASPSSSISSSASHLSSLKSISSHSYNK